MYLSDKRKKERECAYVREGERKGMEIIRRRKEKEMKFLSSYFSSR
jgi:hypothetical protein